MGTKKRLLDIIERLADQPGGDLLRVATVDPEDDQFVLVGGERVHIDNLDLWMEEHGIHYPPLIILDF